MPFAAELFSQLFFIILKMKMITEILPSKKENIVILWQIGIFPKWGI